ncbi:MAG: hypothetical protein U0163_20415 [Gemmatimonadaceae bacterium]
MADATHFHRLERMYLAAPINRFFEPAITISDGRAEVRFTVRPDFHHAAHAMHGSVYFKALDDAAFFAVNSAVTDVFVLTVVHRHALAAGVSGARDRNGTAGTRLTKLVCGGVGADGRAGQGAWLGAARARSSASNTTLRPGAGIRPDAVPRTPWQHARATRARRWQCGSRARFRP